MVVMNLVTGFILALAMCLMFASVTAGAYAILNKPQQPGTTLLSAEDLAALEDKFNEAKDDVSYSNVLNARIGYDPGMIKKTVVMPPADCQALCIGSSGCEGFQITGQNGCDLLANVAATYAFQEPGYNLFTAPLHVPLQVYGPPSQGLISGSAVTPSSSPLELFTKQECAKKCHSTTGCKSFSLSTTSGCQLKTAKTAADAEGIYESGDYKSYFLKDVNHSSGWVWKTPAPSPSPT